MARWGGRQLGGPRRLKVLMAVLAGGAAALGTAMASAHSASEPVVHLYDVQVTGVVRTTFSLPSKPLPFDVAWSETSTWTETYRGVRLSVQSPEYLPEPTVQLKAEGKGTITGSIKYRTSGPRSKDCEWRSTAREPGYLRLAGTPYSSSAPGARQYQLDLVTGRQRTGRQLRPTTCSYYENPRSAKFAGLGVAAGHGTASGWVDTRAVVFNLELRSAQQTGQLAFPLNRLNAGAGFVLNLKGKTRQQSGRLVSEGTARVTFVPRPS